MTSSMRAAVLALAAIATCLAVAHPRAAASRSVTFRSEDGVALAATWYEAARQPAPAVILLHMLSRSREDWQVVANRLADSGIHALAVDFRGHGASGRAEPAGELAPLVGDVRAARTFLAARAESVRADAIGIAGASLGANVAALAAAGVEEKFSYVSTAGGAFLEWMEGKSLPGVAALIRAA